MRSGGDDDGEFYSKAGQEKTKKPTKEFPLFPHSVGVWAKKVRGKFFYVGPWDKPDQALAEWNDQKDYILQHGEKKPDVGSNADALTINRLADELLTEKHDRVESGELSIRSDRDYVTILQHVSDVFHKDRLVPI